MSISSSTNEAILESPPADAPEWEERSVQRVVDTGRDQLLDRSRKIVDAAYELLDDGLDELTIRAVLARTGLSRRAFYERFSGKDDLVLAVFEHTIRLAQAHYRGQLVELSGSLERLQLIVTSLVLGRDMVTGKPHTGGGRRGAAMSREHLRLAESHPDQLQAALLPLVTLIAEQLTQGMEEGVIRKGEPLRMAALIYNLVSTTVHRELLSSEAGRADRESLAEEIWEFCLCAVKA